MTICALRSDIDRSKDLFYNTQKGKKICIDNISPQEERA